jgi:hypothetical protein
MKEKEEKRAVFLRAELYSEMEEIVNANDFGSDDEYLEFVLEEVLDEDERELVFGEEEEKGERKGLKDLGYLD